MCSDSRTMVVATLLRVKCLDTAVSPSKPKSFHLNTKRIQFDFSIVEDR